MQNHGVYWMSYECFGCSWVFCGLAVPNCVVNACRFTLHFGWVLVGGLTLLVRCYRADFLVSCLKP